jgi:glycosyltransferase involved in cell wall biosynthesis
MKNKKQIKTELRLQPGSGVKVTYLNRAPYEGRNSIEGLFNMIIASLGSRLDVTRFFCDIDKSRLTNSLNARRASGDINHVTGDVHYLMIFLKGKKNILTIHDLGFLENCNSKMKRLIFAIFWFYLPLKRARYVTVVSNFTKQTLLKYFSYPEERIRVIPNPVKPSLRFSERRPASKGPIVLFIGRNPNKNLGNLIEALPGTSYALRIVGKPTASEIARMDELRINYSVTSNITEEQLLEEYQKCDVLFFASLYEGFGMPIIEAQKVGRPVITSNFGAMLEVAGDSALTVNPFVPAEIADALNLLTDDATYNKYVKLGLDNADRYGLANIAQQYFDLYQHLAGIDS